MDAVTAAITGSGTSQNKKLGRILIGLVAAANILIFCNNVRNLLADEDIIEAPRAASRLSRSAVRDIPTVKIERVPRPGRRRAGSPAAAPAYVPTGEFATARDRTAPARLSRRLPIVVSRARGDDDVPRLRRLVGSLQHWHPELSVAVYRTGNLSEESASTLASWRGVDLVEARSALAEAAEDVGLLSMAQRLSGITAGLGYEPGEKDSPLISNGAQISEWQPVILFHAVAKHGAALYVEPWGFLTGWIDHTIKALMRDGVFVLCGEGGSRTPPLLPAGVVGISNKRTEVMDQLMHQVLCSLGKACAEQPPSSGGTLGLPEADEGSSGPRTASGSPEEPHREWDGSRALCHRAGLANIDLRVQEALQALDTDPDALREHSDGGGPDVGREAMESIRQLSSRYSCLVRLKDEQGLLGQVQYSFESDTGDDSLHIAIGVPSTTKGTQISSPEELPFLSALLPSVISTIDSSILPGFRYTLLVGYEVADRVLDNPRKLERVFLLARDAIGDNPINLKILRFPPSGSSTFIWNALFRVASAEGADYFLAVHDDSTFSPPVRKGSAPAQQWAEALTSVLKGNPMQGNLGVAAPFDQRNPRALTHPLVHVRTHESIFSSLFPSHLGNQEHEEWISRVYGPRCTFVLSAVPVWNGNRFIGRARGCTQGKDAVEAAIKDGFSRMRSWARSLQ